MQMPNMMPARLRSTDQPIPLIARTGGMAFAEHADILPAGDWLQCSACCAGKAGFGACVARCVATGQACDGGLNNCTPCW